MADLACLQKLKSLLNEQNMKENIFPAIKITLVFALFFSAVYTTIVLGIAQFADGKGEGQVITDKGKKYYANVGQKFTDDKYFQSRPSAVEYNAAGAGGSNKGPSNPEYLALVQGRIVLLHIIPVLNYPTFHQIW